jgi:hypothetical protein
MKNRKKFMLFAVIISIFGATSFSTVEAELTFGEITVSPSVPTAKSTITISISTSGDIPSELRVIVEECDGRTGICFSDFQNVSMSLISMENYQTSVTLKHTEATYINCTIVAKINGTWTPHAKWKIVNLSENTNGNTNGNDDDSNNKTPGFEAVLIIIAIGVSLIAIRQKREK